MLIAWLDQECLSVYFCHPQLVWFAFICLFWVLSPDLFWESLLTWLCALQMRLIAAESVKAYNGGPLDGNYYQHSSFTPLEAGWAAAFSNWRSCARWTFAKCACKLTLGFAWCISSLRSNCQVNTIYLILHQVEDLPLEWVLELC